MGIFDEVKSAIDLGSSEAAQHPAALAAIESYINSPQVGGVAGVQKMFEEKGLGGIVGSWIGSGQNLPVSSEQLQGALHSEALQQAAQKAGIDPTQLTSLMSTLLPHLIDKMTPNGQSQAATS
jgi:uncharacterized protein YidB (DUF937 family)